MDNVIRFPNSEFKKFRDLKKIPEMPESHESNGEAKLSDYLVCIPVKFSEKTRHEEYYLITHKENKRVVYETTEYIKVDMHNPFDQKKWIYPEKGKGMSGFEFDNLKHFSKKYLFLHSAYAKHFIYLFVHDNENFTTKYLKHLGDLPLTLQINGRDNYKYSLNVDRANEFGLMLSRGYTDELELMYVGRTQVIFPYIHGLSAVVYDGENERLMFLEPLTLREGFDEKYDESLSELDNILFVENKAMSEIYMNDFLAHYKNIEVRNGKE